MYPALRLAKEILLYRTAPALPVTGTHVSHHLCWPWDLDPWSELNNGRTLTLYDLGRIPLINRTGLRTTMRVRGWRLTVAGSSVRYRRRIRAFDRLEMRSHVAGWDARFLYMDQSLWRQGDCAGQVLIRSAILGPGGIVPPAELMAAAGRDTAGPDLPDWIRAWAAAEARRPWPPLR